MQKKVDVTCIGQACIDVLIGWKYKEITLQEKERKVSSETTIAVGGDGANLSLILARMGIGVEFISTLADDSAGDIICGQMKRAGVILKKPVRTGRTQIVSVFVPENRERSFIFGGQDYPDFSISPEMVQNCRILSLNSLLRPPLLNPENVLCAVKSAHEAGAIVCADIYTRWEITDLDQYAGAFRYMDYFFLNEDEAKLYSGQKDAREAARIFSGMGVRTVLVKLGEKGCLVIQNGQEFHFPAVRPETVQDTTGAGDSFMAGFEIGLLEQRSLEECCRIGARAAAACIARTGAVAGIYSRSQIMDDSPVELTRAKNKEVW